jgi:hypothetical protein
MFEQLTPELRHTLAMHRVAELHRSADPSSLGSHASRTTRSPRARARRRQATSVVRPWAA